MNDISALLNIILGGGLVAMLTAVVAAIRKYKSGEIVDDDAVIARLDKDNQALRVSNTAKDEVIETERKMRWAAEETANKYRLRLMKYEEVEEHDGTNQH